MSKPLMPYQCSRCGCIGLHSCIGYKPKPLTKEEVDRVWLALKQMVTEEGR